MQVNRGLFEIAMAEQDLDGSQVCSGLQQMSREAVPQSVRMNVSAEPGTFGGFPARLPHHFAADWPLARMPAVAGEQPGLRPSPEATPILTKCIQQDRAQHHIAIFTALSTPDMNDHSLTINIADL